MEAIEMRESNIKTKTDEASLLVLYPKPMGDSSDGEGTRLLLAKQREQQAYIASCGKSLVTFQWPGHISKTYFPLSVQTSRL